MLYEKIDNDLKTAMKEKNEVVTGTLRMLKAAIKNKEIEKKAKNLSEPEVLEMIQKQIKQRRDSIADFEKANRQDLVEKEKSEIAVLEGYLPKQLTDDELKAIIQKSLQSVGAKTKADTGKVMKEVMPQMAGRADGKRVSQILSLLLQ
ncbi:MAG: GatB/YqeY domain-containing protein [Candidatus Omnitrophica bacterium]|nr:GatB/YqeY domain-containing protein [Candidatus Omnitrophota bacterium]